MRMETAPGNHEGDLFIAVTASRVAIFEHKLFLGIISRVGKLLVEFPRADLQAATFQPSGMGASHLTFALRDGKRLETQVAHVHRGKAEKVADALGADAPSDN